MVNKAMSIAQRAQAFALLEVGIPVKRICEITGLSKSTVFRIRQTAKERGYDASISQVFKDEYFEDAPRSGRPRVCIFLSHLNPTLSQLFKTCSKN